MRVPTPTAVIFMAVSFGAEVGASCPNTTQSFTLHPVVLATVTVCAILDLVTFCVTVVLHAVAVELVTVVFVSAEG